MTGILSLVTYLPLVGVAALVLLRFVGSRDQARAWEAGRWIALATTIATFALSLVVIAGFDPANPGFQFVEDFAWFAEQVPSAHLRLGSKIEGHDTAIHRADYQLNEAVIPLGIDLMSRAVLALMR